MGKPTRYASSSFQLSASNRRSANCSHCSGEVIAAIFASVCASGKLNAVERHFRDADVSLDLAIFLFYGTGGSGARS